MRLLLLTLLATLLAGVAPAGAASVTRFHVDWTEANASGAGESALSPYVTVRERATGTMAQVECNQQATPQCRYGFGSIPSTHVEADGAHAVAIVDDDPAAGRSFCATAQSGIASDAVSYTGTSVVTDLGGAQRPVPYSIDAGNKVAPLGATPQAGWTSDCQVTSTAPPAPTIPAGADGAVRLELTWSGDPSPRFYVRDSLFRELEGHCSGAACFQNTFFAEENTSPAIPALHWTGTPGKLDLIDEAPAMARPLCLNAVGLGTTSPTDVTATIFDPGGGSRVVPFTIANGQDPGTVAISPADASFGVVCGYDWGRVVPLDQKLKLSRKGRVRLRLGTAQAGFPHEELSGPAPLDLTLVTIKTKHRKSVPLGRLHTTVPLVAGRMVTVKLTRSGRKAIGHRKRVSISIEAKERDPKGKVSQSYAEARLSGPGR